MMSRSYQRPENALKRANEFIDVGKPSRALEVLYEVIKRGKMRTNYSEKLLEPIMFKYLELCVDLKKSHLAKEGLYQYRNIFQSVNVSSLETVVKFYLQLADERTESARKESHQAVVDIDDLDNLATPEEILLSAVSGEDAQDRSDRTILTPWVKFLWESYRQCLELLRTNSRVEKLYHNIAQHAFKFCEKYNRKTEFRKLCDNLRTHLSHIQKQQGSATAVNLNNPETQQLNLETRLEQLNYAIKMELWQEAYKAIEDISDLMKKSKKMPKPHVMASYYEKLGLVFWKAGNHLFHAAALLKLFQLLRDQKKNITHEELSKRASIVLVATLAIPLPSAHPEFDRFIETEKSALEKIERLANLLSLSKPPTRESLIKDLVRLNVVNTVPVELQNLYQLMEVEFDPLQLCKRMQTHLQWVNERPESGLPQYINALQEMTITRLVKQVGQVYQTITFERLLNLSVFMTAFQLERILVDLVRHNDLQIRIDHRTSCTHFGVDLSQSQREDLPEGPNLQTLPSEMIRCQLAHMSSALQRCLALIAPERRLKEMEPVRAQTIQLYQQTREMEHHLILQRQHIIEERKEMLENQNLEKEEQLRKAQEEQLKRQKEEEQERLRREASKREKERQEEQLKQIHTKQIKDKLMQISKTSYGQKMIEKIDKEELLNLGAEEILQRQVEELEKERKELQKKLKTQEKSVDYFERARRLLEIPRLKKALEQQKEKDKVFWETQERERVSKMVEEHSVALEHSTRLIRMLPDRDIFIEKLKTARRSEIQKKLNDFNARLEVERKNRLMDRKEQRRKERREAYYRQKEEDEQQRRDEEMKKEREDEERREIERSNQEEEERATRRKGEMERDEDGPRIHAERNGEIDEDHNGTWSMGMGGMGPPKVWRMREQMKLDYWRKKEEPRESVSERLSSRDIRRTEPPKERSRPDDDSWRNEAPRDEPPPRKEERDDWRSGPPGDRSAPNKEPERDPPPREAEKESSTTREMEREGDVEKAPPQGDDGREAPHDREGASEKAPSRDRNQEFEKRPPEDREFERAPPPKDRTFEWGAPRDRDMEKGPTRNRDGDFDKAPPRDYERGPRDRGDRDYERGPRDRGDRDYERGPARDRGDRDYDSRGPRDRGDRDYDSRGPRDRDYERGAPSRDLDFGRGPPRDFQRGAPREFTRGAPRDRDIERGPPRDFDRGTRDRSPDWRGGGGGRRDFEPRRDDDRRGPSRADGEVSWRRSEPVSEPKRESFPREERRDTRKSYNAWRGGAPPMSSPSERDESRGGDVKREPKREEPKREEPKREEPKRDDPKRDDPKREEPKRDDPKREEPKRDDPKREEPKRDDPKREDPRRDDPKRDDPKRDDPKRDDAKGAKEPRREPKRPKEEADEDGWTTVRR